jgi:hypothetical protein
MKLRFLFLSFLIFSPVSLFSMKEIVPHPAANLYERQLEAFIQFDFGIQYDVNEKKWNVLFPRMGILNKLWGTKQEKVDFLEWQEMVKDVWFTMQMKYTGSGFERLSMVQNIHKLRLWMIIHYTNNVSLDKLPEEVKEVVERRRRFLTAFEQKDAAALAELVKKPLWATQPVNEGDHLQQYFIGRLK